MPMPDRPKDAEAFYRAFIDHLVEITPSNLREFMRVHGVYSRAKGDEEATAFVASLSAEQRETLLKIIDDQRVAGIYDVLSDLEWWTKCHDVQLTYRGDAVPTPFVSWFGDYIGRLSGDWEWPTTQPRGDANS